MKSVIWSITRCGCTREETWHYSTVGWRRDCSGPQSLNQSILILEWLWLPQFWTCLCVEHECQTLGFTPLWETSIFLWWNEFEQALVLYSIMTLKWTYNHRQISRPSAELVCWVHNLQLLAKPDIGQQINMAVVSISFVDCWATWLLSSRQCMIQCMKKISCALW